MFSHFFIDRPIFTWVLSIILMGLGGIALFGLPVQQYPLIAPPEVTITVIYPGASAEALDKTVTQLIEQKLLAIDNLRYFTSNTSSTGNAEIRLTFENGTNPDIAQVQTQNKLSQAIPTLPEQVQRLGLPVEKSTRSFGLVVALYAEDGKVNQDDLGDFVASKLQEPIGRLEGVGQIIPFSPQHSLRVWLNPEKLFYYKLTSLEVIAAIRDQNAQLASGQIGGGPALDSQQINASINSQTLLTSEEEFREIILKTLPDGSTVRLGDVARIEVGSENYDTIRKFNGKVAAGFAVSLSPTANALETIEAVKAKIKELEPTFPKGVKAAFPIDVSPFIELSVHEVIETLVIAIVLVLIIMYVFLQNWRSTLIPGLAIPVVLLGTLAFLSMIGYSINILTLFAMVLAIGLLVDDAIVVAENVKRILDEDPDISPIDAAKKSMVELWGALLGVTAVIWAVFLPMAFFGGSTGIIYRQFSLTILAAMTLSLFVALTLSPMLCAVLLRNGEEKKENRFFQGFNKYYDQTAKYYEAGVKWILAHFWMGLGVFAGFVIVTMLLFSQIPSAFLPDEDQGRMIAIIEGPANATFSRMEKVMIKVEDFFLKEFKGATEGLFSLRGYNIAGRGQNAAGAFLSLKEYDKRENKVSVFDIASRGMKEFAQERDAKVTFVAPPAIQELGNAKGFEFQLTDQTGIGREQLLIIRDQLLGALNQNPNIAYARLNSLQDTPQYKLDIDYRKAKSLGLTVESINNTLTSAWGSVYVNNYIERNRVKRVFIQGDTDYRMDPNSMSKWFVRNDRGEMVSFGDFSSGQWTYGPPQLQRFNGILAFVIQGEPAPGKSSGEAMQAIMDVHKSLPKGSSIAWTGLSYEEQQAGSQVFALYAISIVTVFLCLAALYESWAIPFAILLVLPLGIFGSALFVWIAGLSNDIYFKVGFLLTMGLAAKNAILIVEFAEFQIREGKSATEAAIEACKQRFRPILMTSFAFILGVLPLALASGPGSGAQNSIGTTLLGGMVTSTLLIIFFAPLFFVLILNLKERFSRGDRETEKHA